MGVGLPINAAVLFPLPSSFAAHNIEEGSSAQDFIYTFEPLPSGGTEFLSTATTPPAAATAATAAPSAGAATAALWENDKKNTTGKALLVGFGIFFLAVK